MGGLGRWAFLLPWEGSCSVFQRRMISVWVRWKMFGNLLVSTPFVRSTMASVVFVLIDCCWQRWIDSRPSLGRHAFDDFLWHDEWYRWYGASKTTWRAVFVQNQRIFDKKSTFLRTLEDCLLLGVMFRSHLDSPFSLKQTGHCPCWSKLCHRGRQFLLILYSSFTGSMDAVTNHLPA